MAAIIRCPAIAASTAYDLIIIGGGIYGVMLLLEASRRGLKALLLEGHDFGAGTSFNSLRIIHGGLRYLQSLDFHRFRESVQERHWFLRAFPELVKPLPCLMPLYGAGLRRCTVLRIALWANDMLSWNRNRALLPDRCIPPGHILNADQTRRIFPGAKTAGLQGSAVWYDAYMPDSHRIVLEAIRWACELGGTALNYVRVQELIKSKQHVAGVIAVDVEEGGTYEFKARTVINATGPHSRFLANRFDRDIPQLFRPSLAWNVLFNRKAPSDYALAICPDRDHGQTYFILPWKGMLLAGTDHASWNEASNEPTVSIKQLTSFIRDINSAIPDLNLEFNDVIKIFAGFLPVTETGGLKLTTREVIIDHARHDGPQDLYSVAGVKFTTSRLVAEKTLNFISRQGKVKVKPAQMLKDCPPNLLNMAGVFDFDWNPAPGDGKWKEDIRKLINEESVLHLDDLVLRRTNLGDNPHRALALAPDICDFFPWDSIRCTKELAALKETVSIDKQLIYQQFPVKF